MLPRCWYDEAARTTLLQRPCPALVQNIRGKVVKLPDLGVPTQTKLRSRRSHHDLTPICPNFVQIVDRSGNGIPVGLGFIAIYSNLAMFFHFFTPIMLPSTNKNGPWLICMVVLRSCSVELGYKVH